MTRKSHGTAAVTVNETAELRSRLYANHAKTYTIDLATFCNQAEPEWFAVRVRASHTINSLHVKPSPRAQLQRLLRRRKYV